MNGDPVELIARAVLYEGYLLYPYRPSAIKNRQRFNFGVLYPHDYCLAQEGSERSRMQTECPVQGSGETRLEISVRFLQLVEQSLDEWRADPGMPPSSVRRDSRLLNWPRCWAAAPGVAFECSSRADAALATVPAVPPTCGSAGPAVCGEVRAAVDEVRPGAYRLTVRVANLTVSAPAHVARRGAVTVARVGPHRDQGYGGELVSLLDPPESTQDVARSCAQRRRMAGAGRRRGQPRLMLASPIILYDYPQVAAESPGDLFDGTEIDEILALRVLTMTDDEKREARDVGRARAARSSTGPTPSRRNTGRGCTARCADCERCGGRPDERVGVAAARGADAVGSRARSRRRTDRRQPGAAAPAARAATPWTSSWPGRTAVIEAIEQDYEGAFHVALVFDDDPGRDFGFLRQPGHRFFYAPDEVEPLADADAAASGARTIAARSRVRGRSRAQRARRRF